MIIPRGSQVSRFNYPHEKWMPLQGCEADIHHAPQDDMERFFRSLRMVTRSQSFCQLLEGGGGFVFLQEMGGLVKGYFKFLQPVKSWMWNAKRMTSCNHNGWRLAIITKISPAILTNPKELYALNLPSPPWVVCCCQVLVLQRLVVTIGGPGDWVLKSLCFFFKSMGSMGSERYIYRSISNFFMNQMWENDHENTGILWILSMDISIIISPKKAVDCH